MIRIANERDIPDIVRLCFDFYDSSPYRDEKWDEMLVRKTVQNIVFGDQTQRIAFVSYDAETEEVTGVLIGIISSLPFSDSRLAAELVWWVDPEYRKDKSGVLLLEAYEYWAKEIAKAEKIQVVNLNNLDLSKLYERRGYKMIETAYMKTV